MELACYSSDADAGIDRRVNEITEQSAEENRRGRDEVERDKHRIVALEHGLIGETAETGPRKNRLNDHRPAEQRGQKNTKVCNQRSQRIAQCMFVAVSYTHL